MQIWVGDVLPKWAYELFRFLVILTDYKLYFT